MAIDGIDEIFESHRQQQYLRELLFSTVMELVSLASLGLRPSSHAAAQDEDLRMTLRALYDMINGQAVAPGGCR